MILFAHTKFGLVQIQGSGVKRGAESTPLSERVFHIPVQIGLKTRKYNMGMNKGDLEKLSKSELIKLLLKQKKSKKVRNHEDLLDSDPFKDEVFTRGCKTN